MSKMWERGEDASERSSEREVDGFAADKRRVGGPADGAGKRGGVIERECDVFGLVGVGAERDLHAGEESGAGTVRGCARAYRKRYRSINSAKKRSTSKP